MPFSGINSPASNMRAGELAYASKHSEMVGHGTQGGTEVGATKDTTLMRRLVYRCYCEEGLHMTLLRCKSAAAHLTGSTLIRLAVWTAVQETASVPSGRKKSDVSRLSYSSADFICMRVLIFTVPCNAPVWKS